jgi:predicted nucleic acid-binding protein
MKLIPRLFDTSVMIPVVRGEAYERLFRKALRSGRARLSSVVMQELYAGASTEADKRDYDRLNQAFVSRGYMLTPEHEDWVLAGILIAQYRRRYGNFNPRDHLNDVLIALSASRVAAELITENVADMNTWKSFLKRMGRRLNVKGVQRKSGK